MVAVTVFQWTALRFRFRISSEQLREFRLHHHHHIARLSVGAAFDVVQ